MPRRRINIPKLNHIDYLQNVVDNWIEFCKHHPDFEDAILKTLLDNRRLNIEVLRLRNKVSELEERLNERNS